VTPGPDVAEDIKNFVKIRLAAYEYPREVEFVKELPMTATGKIMRRELKKMELQRKAKAH
jgi:acetyl-CoA synthetase